MENSTNEEKFEFRRKWRKRWLNSICNFSNYEHQKLTWLAPLEPHCSNIADSFVEYMCSYFDDILLSDSYVWALEEGLVSEQEVSGLSKMHALLKTYKPPNNNDYDDRAVLSDPVWKAIVEEALRAKQALLLLLSDPEEIGALQ